MQVEPSKSEKVTQLKLPLFSSEPRELVLDCEPDHGSVQQGFGLKGFCNGQVHSSAFGLYLRTRAEQVRTWTEPWTVEANDAQSQP